MKPIAGLLAGCLACIPALCMPRLQTPEAQTAAEAPLSAEAARADLDFLYRSLQSAHYDLNAHRPKAEYDACFREVASRLSKPVDRLGLIRELQPFVAFGKVGHAHLEFPMAEYIRAAQEGGTILPFDLRIEGDRAFVTHSYLKGSQVRPGAELLSFDGRPMKEVVVEVSRFVSGERPYMVNAQLERFFPRWLWVMRGSIPRLRVAGRTPAGRRFVETIAGLPIGEVEPRKSEWTEVLSGRELRFLDARTAYLRPGPFYATEGGDSMDVAAFRRFIDDAFGKILAAKPRTLIIDVRDNPGGDNSFSDLMVAWIADRPFRFSHDFSIKASPEIRRQFEKQSAGAPEEGGIVGQMYRAIKDRKDGDIVPIDLPLVPPRPERFRGRVLLLVNRHSYSNATCLAAMLQDFHFAQVVGEETADLPTSYASSAQFTLPNSGLTVSYPKGRFVRPSGDTALRGVVPDIVIPASVFLQGPEAVLRACVEIAKAQRAR